MSKVRLQSGKIMEVPDGSTPEQVQDYVDQAGRLDTGAASARNAAPGGEATNALPVRGAPPRLPVPPGLQGPPDKSFMDDDPVARSVVGMVKDFGRNIAQISTPGIAASLLKRRGVDVVPPDFPVQPTPASELHNQIAENMLPILAGGIGANEPASAPPGSPPQPIRPKSAPPSSRPGGGGIHPGIIDLAGELPYVGRAVRLAKRVGLFDKATQTPTPADMPVGPEKLWGIPGAASPTSVAPGLSQWEPNVSGRTGPSLPPILEPPERPILQRDPNYSQFEPNVSAPSQPAPTQSIQPGEQVGDLTPGQGHGIIGGEAGGAAPKLAKKPTAPQTTPPPPPTPPSTPPSLSAPSEVPQRRGYAETQEDTGVMQDLEQRFESEAATQGEVEKKQWFMRNKPEGYAPRTLSLYEGPEKVIDVPLSAKEVEQVYGPTQRPEPNVPGRGPGSMLRKGSKLLKNTEPGPMTGTSMFMGETGNPRVFYRADVAPASGKPPQFDTPNRYFFSNRAAANEVTKSYLHTKSADDYYAGASGERSFIEPVHVRGPLGRIDAYDLMDKYEADPAQNTNAFANTDVGPKSTDFADLRRDMMAKRNTGILAQGNTFEYGPPANELMMFEPGNTRPAFGTKSKPKLTRKGAR